MQSYDIVYEGGSGEITEKKSRFIAQVFPVHSEEEALAHIEEVRKKYWDARHNCHAFVIGANNETSRCSDDGEPSGTAGRPILEVLTGSGVHDTLIVVTRYFGGTLLGTGGLVRAYSQAAQAGLAASKIITKLSGRKVVIHTDYNGVGKLQYLVGQRGLAVLDTDYTDAVEMTVLVPEEQKEAFEKEVTEATSGQAGMEWSDELLFAVLDGAPLLFETS
jgi:uncharacterized YigZ family protein